MVSSKVEVTRREMLPEDTEQPDYSCDGSPLPANPSSEASDPNLRIPTQNRSGDSNAKKSCQTGPKKHKSASEKKYLGVRVKMPVRDMLRNIRIAKGIDPKDLLGKHSKASKGDKKRVTTGGNRRRILKKHQTKGLEELAIIVEVLEEDLKTCQSYRLPNKTRSASYSSEFWVEEASQQGLMNTYGLENEIPLSPSYSAPSETSPVHSVCSSYPSPTYSQGTDVFFGNQEEYSSYESDKYRYDNLYGMTCSPASSCEYQVPSPQESFHASPNPEVWEVSPQEMKCPPWPYSQQEEWSSMTFFWTQMEREETMLKKISDQELLAVDENGKILLHRVVEEGKRSLVYVIARRMVALKKLDIKDSEGKTPLHLAAQKNQHFMVADLVSLGANVNAKDRYGKTCLHLSAENGYIRVLEVLKGLMRIGVYINLEERDANGLSALQCAAVALNHTVRELELCESAGHLRLHSLRKEQMMETLECLLQMECCTHAPDHGRLNLMNRGVDSKQSEQAAFFQSNKIKVSNNMI
ncbi:NF-kappa-B inhibitor zeta isoform X1 [Ctenopharyngodon idella]|uniref:NF-kappa-B inhibitor zeta isoform X1 n=1 Tax=Ctenopharyngodon idella TaxID=7959 RepID=UPI00222E5E92|nr:NF-kappa-B inhibitor zeta isoform X1 [Ctenopharyngodon idella]